MSMTEMKEMLRRLVTVEERMEELNLEVATLKDHNAGLDKQVARLETQCGVEAVEVKKTQAPPEFTKGRHACRVVLIAPPRQVRGEERGSLGHLSVQIVEGKGMQARLHAAKNQWGQLVKTDFLGDIPSMPSPGVWCLDLEMFLKGEDSWTLIRTSVKASKVTNLVIPDVVELDESEAYRLVPTPSGGSGRSSILHWEKVEAAS